MIAMLDPAHYFYHDLPIEEQQRWTSLLNKSPRESNYTPISHAAYLYHPVTYLYCEKDNALPLEIQKMMAEKVKKQGVHVDEESCVAGHSSFLSMPGRVSEVVESMTESVK